MSSNFRKPLVLALASALFLTACQPEATPGESSNDQAAAPAATPAPAAPALDLSEVRTQVVRFQASDLDPAVAACDDFNAHVNGSWLAANPVPSDRTTWGSFETLSERSMEIQRILAEAAAANANATGVAKLVGDFYASAMDEEAIERAGATPLEPVLARIATLESKVDVANYVREAYANG